MQKVGKGMSLLLITILILGVFVGCNNDKEELIKNATTLDWWVSPVFADAEERAFIEDLATAFCNKHPKATINISVLPAGEEQSYLEKASQEGKMPNIYFGALGDIQHLENQKYVDLSSVLPEENEISESFIKEGDLTGKEQLDFYPIVAQPYLLAFNQSLLEQNGALELLPTDGDRKWSMDEYIETMEALREKLPSNIDIGVFPYGATEGDIATKAFVLNAFSAGTVDQISQEAGIKGLTALQKMMRNNLLATDEISLAESNAQPNLLVNGFAVSTSEALQGFLAQNSVQSLVYSLDIDIDLAQKTEEFEVIFMPYPSDGEPNIPYELLGMTVFDNGNEDQLLAGQVLTDFVANDEEWREKVCGYAGGISVNPNYNQYLTGEYAYLPNTLSMMKTYRAYGYEDDNEKLAWMYLLRNVAFYGEDPATAVTEYEKAKSQDLSKKLEDIESNSSSESSEGA